MQITNVPISDALDLFDLPKAQGFGGMAPIEGADIFDTIKPDIKPPVNLESLEPDPIINPEIKKTEDIDIFDLGEDGKKPEEKPNDFNLSILDILIEKGELKQLVDDEDKPYEIKTPEDVLELWRLNKEELRGEILNKAEETIIDSKSPTWKALLKYSEYYENPADIIPLLEGVQNIQTVEGLDENTPEGAEEIYRIHLSLNGESPEVITDMIDMAKTSEKLEYFANKFKPVLLQKESERITAEASQAASKYQDLLKTINENHQFAVQSLETPLFGNISLSVPEKAAVYDLVGTPTKEGGYGIYAEIDRLYAEKDFDKLIQIGLLLKNEKFYDYASQNKLDKSGEDLQKKLRLSTRMTSKSQVETPEPITTGSKIVKSKTNSGFGFYK